MTVDMVLSIKVKSLDIELDRKSIDLSNPPQANAVYLQMLEAEIVVGTLLSKLAPVDPQLASYSINLRPDWK